MPSSPSDCKRKAAVVPRYDTGDATIDANNFRVAWVEMINASGFRIGDNVKPRSRKVSERGRQRLPGGKRARSSGADLARTSNQYLPCRLPSYFRNAPLAISFNG